MRLNLKLMKRLATYVIWAAAVVLGLGLTSCAVFFSGPYQPTTPLPPEKIVDIHCHTAGLGGGDSGCFVSKELRQIYKFDIYLKSFGVTRAELMDQGDPLIIDRISAQIARSEKVGQAVILALDGVVSEAGELDLARTEVHVPNEFVAREVARHTNLLFGASINPYRKDALARLDQAAAQGAVLVKWIPSIMQIDPADERLIPFYRRMVELKLPLLSHAGQERSFTRANDALCDPQRLRLPLKLGVTVIVAHIASTGENEGRRDTDRLLPLLREFPNLYSEISSLTQLNKPGYLREALTKPEFQGRLLYGSDFPLINTALVSAWYYPLRLTTKQMNDISGVENPWDRDVALKQALGVPTEIFARSREVLAQEKMKGEGARKNGRALRP